MKKGLLYTSVVLLYALAALFGLAAINTMISLKYEVDEVKIFVEINQQMSAEAKQKRIEELNEEGKQLKFQANGLFVTAASAFTVATLILISSSRILKKRNVSVSETETSYAEKGKGIQINNKEKLIQILSRIVEILRDNAYHAQANAVKKPLQYLYLDDVGNFIKHLDTVEMWGGAGAVWEVYLQPKKVEMEFMKCIVDLVDELNKTGINISKERDVSKAFKKVLNIG